MQLELQKAGTLHYRDSGGDGPVLLFVHGVLINGTQWDEIASSFTDEYRVIIPELPLGAHPEPMPKGTDRTLLGIVHLLADFLDELALENVTIICNDWGGAQLLVSEGRASRVSQFVLTSCEAFDNYPPGIPGRLLCMLAWVPGGLFASAQILRPRFLRHLPITFGHMSKKRVDNELFARWNEPLRNNRGNRKDLGHYLTHLPKKKQQREWADQVSEFEGRVLILWASEDKLMPPEHAEALAELLPNAELVWVDDSYTLVTVDQPEICITEIDKFLKAS